MENNYLNLRTQRKRLHLLAKPSGFVSGMAMDNPGYQMKYSVKLLSDELEEAGTPYVLQLALDGGDERNPDSWALYADGVKVAAGTGDFARSCFEEKAERFLEICREAVAQNAQPSFGPDVHKILAAARNIAAVSLKTHTQDER